MSPLKVEGFESIIERLASIGAYISGVALAFVVLVVTANIIMRYLKVAFLGTMEYVATAQGIVIGLSLGYCAIKGGHITIDIVAERLPPRVRTYLNIIANIIYLCFCIIATWQSFVLGHRVAVSGDKLWVTGLQYYPFIYGLGLGFAILTSTVLLDLYKELHKSIRAGYSAVLVKGQEQ